MDHKEFQEWLSGIALLSREQRLEVEAVLSGSSQESASLAAIEAAVGEDRQCPRCHAPGAVLRGRSRGLRRYQCKRCGRTFGARAGTPLSGLHHKEKWLEYGDCLAEGMTIRQSAEHCRRQYRAAAAPVLATQGRGPGKLTGIVEEGGVYILEKGRARPLAARQPSAACRMNRFRYLAADRSMTVRPLPAVNSGARWTGGGW